MYISGLAIGVFFYALALLYGGWLMFKRTYTPDYGLDLDPLFGMVVIVLSTAIFGGIFWW